MVVVVVVVVVMGNGNGSGVYDERKGMHKSKQQELYKYSE